MYNVNPYSTYKEQDLETSSKYELVGKLYAKAAVELRKAVDSIAAKRLDLANDSIIKAQIIIVTLNGSLDQSYSISAQMSPLYQYMLRRLREANVKKDPAILEEVYGLLIQFRDTWREALKAFKKEQLP